MEKTKAEKTLGSEPWMQWASGRGRTERQLPAQNPQWGPFSARVFMEPCQDPWKMQVEEDVLEHLEQCFELCSGVFVLFSVDLNKTSEN